MKIRLISYADKRFRTVQRVCSLSGKYIGGFDEVVSYGPNDIDSIFREKNKEILNNQRGAGLWLWKPYIIDKALAEIKMGEYLFYCDAGSFFIRNIKNIVYSMDQDIWVSDIPLLEKQWTNPQCFEIMDVEDQYKETNQIQAGFICIKKTDKTIEFIKEWLEYCCNTLLLSPEKENKTMKANEYSYFIDHREDQSVLSLLCKKRGIIPHKDPTQFGRYPEGYSAPGRILSIPNHNTDTYKCIIILHRLDRVKIRTFVKWLIVGIGPRMMLKYVIR